MDDMAMDVSAFSLPILKVDTAQLYLDDMYKGVIILGGIGSGKSSGSGAFLAQKFLAYGYGGLVLCSGQDECATWQDYAKRTARDDDVIIVGKEHDNALNFIDVELKKDVPYVQRIDAVVNVFRDALELSMRKETFGGDASFWHEASVKLIKQCLVLLDASRHNTTDIVSLFNVQELIIYAPRTMEQAQHAPDNNDQTDIFWRTMSQVNNYRQSLDEESSQRREIDQAFSYFFDEFPILPDRTRESVVMTVGTVINSLISGITYEFLNTKTTFSLQETFDGKIVIVDLPISHYGTSGRLVQVIIKRLFQQALVQRHIEKNTAPVFLWADEFQNFTTQFDRSFMNEQRKYRGCTVFLTQTIGNIGDELHNIQQARNLLGQFQTAIFHANADHDTNEYAAMRMGKSYQTRTGLNANEFMGAGVSMTPTYAYEVEPIELMQLRTGGILNDGLVDAYVVKSGRPFTTGSHFAKVTFQQGE